MQDREKKLYGCGALIINESHQVLLQLRSKYSRNDIGMWSQPGGAIESIDQDVTEDIIKTNIYREVKEELGIEINIIDYLATTIHSDNHYRWTAYSYLAKIVSGTPQILEPKKHTKIRWINIEDLPDNLNQVTRASVEAYLKKIYLIRRL